jgi:hypothetical protein
MLRYIELPALIGGKCLCNAVYPQFLRLAAVAPAKVGCSSLHALVLDSFL